MTDIPATAREFERWIAEPHDWPQELRDKAQLALLSIKAMDQPNAEKAERFKASNLRDMLALAEAYGEWREMQIWQS